MARITTTKFGHIYLLERYVLLFRSGALPGKMLDLELSKIGRVPVFLYF